MMWRLLFATVFLAGCGSTKTSPDDPDNTTSQELTAATATIGDSAGLAAQTFFRGLARALSRAECSSIAYTACASGVETRTFSPSAGDATPCTRGKGEGYRVFGRTTLTFSDTAACSVANATATVTRTLSNHYIQNGLQGRKVLVYTAAGTVAGQTMTSSDLTDFGGTVRSGGSVYTATTAAAGTLAIGGIHRRGLSAAGKFQFWHTYYTTAASPLQLTFGASTVTVTGTLNIADNRNGQVDTEAFSNVTFSTDPAFPCRHANGGSMTLTISGTAHTITYGATCGATVIDGTSVDLNDSEA